MDERIMILYDGECLWCNKWLMWLLEHDPDDLIRVGHLSQFASVRARFYIDEQLDSILLYKEGQWYTKASAVHEILKSLHLLPFITFLLWAVPQSLTDWGYDLIARHRHRLVNKSDATCVIPNSTTRAKMLDAEGITSFIDRLPSSKVTQ